MWPTAIAGCHVIIIADVLGDELSTALGICTLPPWILANKVGNTLQSRDRETVQFGGFVANYKIVTLKYSSNFPAIIIIRYFHIYHLHLYRLYHLPIYSLDSTPTIGLPR